ncbi:hypothetical protein OG264_16190 [Streptomyces xanthophaeus]|uniref:hypothetical protein n=1 Tax=Streptomyces xanthophaeus TaxID=67385 RepID=UPI00386F5D02|nr:hypothetical protein OG264_16190 [Streptomyces xanthophaeus]WST62125.1 hypothetical protein OG605_22245 [Streptomyces xanthophaeus]
MYETVLDVITLALLVAGVIGCALHRRSVARQVDALRVEVACARIEGVLGTEPGREVAIPSPARPRGES